MDLQETKKNAGPMDSAPGDHPAIRFLEDLINKGLSDLQKAGFYYYSFVIMAQAIEVMGAFLDEKPFRAREQSKERFSRALRTLFPAPYSRLNEKDWLYHKLRNHLVHFLVPSMELLLVRASDLEAGQVHLGRWNGKTVLVAEEFLADVKRASALIIKKLKDGRLREKGFPSFHVVL